MRKFYGPLIVSLVLLLSGSIHAQWSESQLPGTVNGNSVTALATNGTYIFAGVYGGGVFRSSDGGTNWSLASNGLGSTAIVSLGIVGGSVVAGTYNLGLYFSTDNGDNWNSEILPDTGLTGIFSMATNGGVIYAGGFDYGNPPPDSVPQHAVVFKSTDDGMSWIQLPSPNGGGDATVQALVIGPGSKLYAGAAGVAGAIGVYAFDGSTWTAVNNTPMTNETYVYSLAYDGTNLYAGTQGNYVLVSADGGASWTTFLARQVKRFVPLW